MGAEHPEQPLHSKSRALKGISVGEAERERKRKGRSEPPPKVFLARSTNLQPLMMIINTTYSHLTPPFQQRHVPQIRSV